MADVAGWIYQENLDTFVRWVATYLDYPWDDFDDDALVGVLDAADADNPDSWFDYPVVGRPSVTLALAVDEGSDVLRVLITGDLDVVLATRFETLMNVSCCWTAP